ncbi:hypothetical protein RN001_015903 [Aquatica leii]|uniref:Uncharacterized protein n=1 Tax=Aquatica leii TaxID=1421715 RepID=A0AAN7NXD3_9COLE|nr:hypothetical protein RN001_015903 [Aquatica leii]
MGQQKKDSGINFDGRKDKTLAVEKIGSSYHSKKITEQHMVLVAEPGSTYLGHVTPSSGSASSIKTMGCDGTVVNTGFNIL